MAMPSAGSTVPSTDSAGICTTNNSSAVSVRTLTRMLNPSPKKALVSPLVQYGSLSEPSDDAEFLKPVRFMRFSLRVGGSGGGEGGWAGRVGGGGGRGGRGGGVGGNGGSAGQRRLVRVGFERCRAEHGDDRRGIGDPAEDSALRGDHLQADPLKLREVRTDAVADHQGLVPAVVGLPDRGVHADFGGHPGDNQPGDAILDENVTEGGAVEGALSGFVDDDLTVDRRELVDDVVAVLAPDQDPAQRALV